MGAEHVPEGTDVTYNSDPPTSGPHWPEPAPWGFHTSPVPDEQVVHNLEHGGIWISYRDVDEDTLGKLEAMARRYPGAVIVTPRPESEAKIALASWGRLQALDSFKRGVILNFITSNANKSPEPLAVLPQPGIEVGALFPDFRLTELDGRVITRNSVGGKPTIVWFTTSYCVPCQIGARLVSQLDGELGGEAFDVLVVFVDPGEPADALLWWRDQFGGPDWMVAFDEGLVLSEGVGLRFLDTKFLLDEGGIIEDIDFEIADQDYLDLLRGAVRRSA